MSDEASFDEFFDEFDEAAPDDAAFENAVLEGAAFESAAFESALFEDDAELELPGSDTGSS